LLDFAELVDQFHRARPERPLAGNTDAFESLQKYWIGRRSGEGRDGKGWRDLRAARDPISIEKIHSHKAKGDHASSAKTKLREKG